MKLGQLTDIDMDNIFLGNILHDSEDWVLNPGPF